MAIYHCTIKTGGRAAGKSAVAAAAYRSGEKLTDMETGLESDYTRKSGVVYSEVSLCEHAPAEYANRENLWNAVHKIEKASNARLWREIEVALPHEFNRDEQIETVREYVKGLTDRGMCADWSIHDKADGNPHAHIMLTTRSIDANGKWAAKSRKVYDLDENGEKIYQRTDKDGRKQYKSHKEDYNDWNDKERIEEWREAWANVCNKHLSEEKKIDHRSYERQGKQQEPTRHEGYTARKIEAKGGISELCQENREIKARNDILQQIAEQLKTIGEELKQLIAEKGSIGNDRSRIGELFRRRAVAKSERGITDGERAVEEAVTDTDTTEFIRKARDEISDSRTAEKDSGAERENREAMQQRQRIEAEQRIRKAEQGTREIGQQSAKKISRGGRSL